MLCPCFLTGSVNSDVLLAVDCLDKLLRNQRQVSTQRVLGFVKRLATISLQLLPGASLAVLATIKKFMQVGSGQLLAESYCSPCCTVLQSVWGAVGCWCRDRQWCVSSWCPRPWNELLFIHVTLGAGRFEGESESSYLLNWCVRWVMCLYGQYFIHTLMNIGLTAVKVSSLNSSNKRLDCGCLIIHIILL